MKSMLYVGAALMIGASIYGFVDYKQTSKQKEFTKLYSADDPDKDPVLTVIEKKNVKADEDPAIKTAVTKKTTESKVAATGQKKKPVVKKKKRKKFNSDMFSRAPLREEREIVEEPVTEQKKTENKDQ